MNTETMRENFETKYPELAHFLFENLQTFLVKEGYSGGYAMMKCSDFEYFLDGFFSRAIANERDLIHRKIEIAWDKSIDNKTEFDLGTVREVLESIKNKPL